MKHAVFAALAGIAAFFVPNAQCLAAEDAPQTTEQLLVPPYPATAPWKIITNAHDDKRVWIEWIPADQSDADIKDILTEQIFYTLKGRDPNAFVETLLKDAAGACRDTLRNGPKAQIELGYSVAYAQVYCVGNKDKDVDIFIKAIAGNDALYVVQREFRRPAQPGAAPGLTKFTKDQLPEAQARLVAQGAANKFLTDQVKLCPHGVTAGACAGTDAAPVAPAASPPASSSDSVSIDGWPIPGKTTADEVRNKLGRPMTINHMDPMHVGQYSMVFVGQNGALFAFLFDKNDLVVRMQVYKYNPPAAPH